jgi:hypothetical protein
MIRNVRNQKKKKCFAQLNNLNYGNNKTKQFITPQQKCKINKNIALKNHIIGIKAQKFCGMRKY